MYDDDYPTCARTYATLLIYTGNIDPSSVTERLGIEPTSWQRRGEPTHQVDRPSRIAPLSGWFLTSRGHVESKDSRRHVDWLLTRLECVAHVVRSLQSEGCQMQIACYWHSRQGQGGPSVSPSQMRLLGDLEIELWFDICGPVASWEA